MLFNSLQFALFFAVVLLLHRALPSRVRNAVLLGASLIFYTVWIPAYLLLLAADLVANYALLRWMARSARPRIPLAISIVVTLGLLAYFKYAAFVLETSVPALRAVFGFEPTIPDIFLPLGISFYSFQIIALAVDTYRKEIEPVRSLARYALFICFFPQLIAGPILRGREFLPQLARGARPTRERSRRGLWLLGAGLGKKVIFADFLLAGFVDEVFSAPGSGGAVIHWLALYSFAFQIYFDFSGYTDMARGLALLLGYELPLNFMEPYLSRNPAEFWQRWHLTLSRWLRDYLYIPLGGNRRGPARTYVNLMLTMVLGGLWHGASWNFVAWGGIHGLLLVVHRRVTLGAQTDAPVRWRDLPSIVLHFHAVCLAWVFFRTQTFAGALAYVGALFTGGNPVGVPMLQLGVVAACVVLHVVERLARLHVDRYRGWLANRWWGSFVEGAVVGTVLAVACAVSGAGGEFIYFQF
jgi:D-alanyl-lipoteichoic acid acyltransferase DltB (MBOAT superfamily)